MDEKRPILKVNLEPMGIVMSFVIVAIIGGIFFLAQGISARSATAYLILGAIVAIVLIGLGVTITLVIVAFANRITERREMREQARFVDNAKENLAIMQMTAKTQATQNAMLLRQAREAQRQLPAPEGTEDIDALVFDDAVFDELDG
jgi:magnesium-transporting ATPase (P-type)